MPLGAVTSEGSSGESVSHFGSLRIRVYGAGRLLMSVHSLDDIRRKEMVPFTLKKVNRIIPTRIVNFKEQRAAFQLQTTGPNEYFRIHRIVIFSKPSAASYPGS